LSMLLRSVTSCYPPLARHPQPRVPGSAAPAVCAVSRRGGRAPGQPRLCVGVVLWTRRSARGATQCPATPQRQRGRTARAPRAGARSRIPAAFQRAAEAVTDRGPHARRDAQEGAEETAAERAGAVRACGRARAEPWPPSLQERARTTRGRRAHADPGHRAATPCARASPPDRASRRRRCRCRRGREEEEGAGSTAPPQRPARVRGGGTGRCARH